MADNVNIFDTYGIKEVANVYFEALESDTKAGVYEGDIVLFLDTLKVSTIETTAENTAAQGGWGNPKLVQWDYGKEINVTLEDALMSLESLRFMLGGAIKKPGSKNGVDTKVIVRHTAEVICGENGEVPLPVVGGKKVSAEKLSASTIRLINLTTGARTQLNKASGFDGQKKIVFVNPALIDNDGTIQQETKKDDRIRMFWEEEVSSGAGAVEVTISPDTFPGTYRVVGDTYIRSAATGKDEPFQFVINKAKVQSNVTITLQAEGDPTTFEMTLNVLRSTNERGENEMMKLVRYSVEGGETASGNDIGSVLSE